MINKYKYVNAHISMNGKRYVPVNWVINWNCLERAVTQKKPGVWNVGYNEGHKFFT